MESILARALEYTLKYWLKSFSRDQFKLQGRTGLLSNLDINGDVLHASAGFPPALNVTTARVGQLEITLPSVSNVQTEPITVKLDRLDLVLEENMDADNEKSTCMPSPTSSTKGSGYGFADKIADGMTLEIGTANIMIETRGGAKQQGDAIWSSPLASITIRNLLLYTTNENWQVVNLKEARDFSCNKNFIYVFKKLEWESLSLDLLPHPNMFMDIQVSPSSSQENRDDNGAKRQFFGGERFLEGISGQAYITIQRTELNSPLGLEVQWHIPEAVCPSLSEPGLRALLRFMTGVHACLNRGDVDLKAQQHFTEAARCSLVSVIIDHIFLCIKDADFQLELLMQSLLFSRASLPDGGSMKSLSRIMLGGLFLRDTFSHPPCTLIQPSLRSTGQDFLQTPEFAQNFCDPIYPLKDENMKLIAGVPLISLHSLQINPSPTPPKFASQTVIDCQSLMITLQEESCFRISSFLDDRIVANPAVELHDYSVNSFEFILKEFDLVVPVDMQKSVCLSQEGSNHSHSSFSGASLHVEDLYFAQSPTINCNILNLDADPACFSLWEYQPIDASQKKWTTRASLLSVSLETCDSSTKQASSTDWYDGLWRCLEFHEVCFEAAMVTADGSPMLEVPPPEGIVRIGVACQQNISNASVEQLFFVLDLYSYFGGVAEKITKAGNANKKVNNQPMGDDLMKKIPSDTAVSLALNNLRLKFLDSSSDNIQGMPLVQFDGQDLYLKVSHRTLGGAFAVSTSLQWETVSIYCLDGVGALANGNLFGLSIEHDNAVNGNAHPQMRAVFWVDDQIKNQNKPVPFLDISMVHVMPYDLQDRDSHSLSAKFNVNGVRLGGGMTYTESLLYRFGVFGPDGGPGEGLLKGLNNLTSGPLAKLFRASPLIKADNEEHEAFKMEDLGGHLEILMPDDIDVCITFNNWLFALEGTQEMGGWCSYTGETLSREERCWHATFQSLQVNAKSKSASISGNKERIGMKLKFPVELITIDIEGIQALKPSTMNVNAEKDLTFGNIDNDGLSVEICLVAIEDDSETEAKWIVENVKFSVRKPIEAVATREELEHFTSLFRSEVDSMGRITAGMLRLLKLDKSLGQGTIDQLSNLGSASIHKSVTDKLSRRSSFGSVNFTPRTSTSNAIILNDSVESTITSLEVEILDVQAKCSALASELSSSSDVSQRVSDVQCLSAKLENMQSMLTKLRTLI